MLSFSISGTSVDFDFFLQVLLLSVAVEQYKLPEIRYNILFMICSSINAIVLLKNIQVEVGIVVTGQKPYRFTTVFESEIVIRTNYTIKQQFNRMLWHA